MIEDEEIKVAENPTEALWIRVVEARENSIEEHTKAISVEEVFLEAAKAKLKEIQEAE